MNWKRAEQTKTPGEGEPSQQQPELSLLSDSLSNANILRGNPAKELLAFLPAATNPQEPNPRPPTFSRSLCLLQALRSAGRVPFLSPSRSLAAQLLGQLFHGIRCRHSVCTPVLPTTNPSSPPPHLQSLKLILSGIPARKKDLRGFQRSEAGGGLCPPFPTRLG